MKKLCLSLAISFSLSSALAAQWGYGDDNDNWGSISNKYATCNEGRAQSPINIDTRYTKSASNSLTMNYKTDSTKVSNNGHSVQVDYDMQSSVVFKNKTYKLLQLHFHTPAENKIDNKRYPLEVHLVHKSNDGQLLVVGVLFEEGKSNSELKKILAQAPKHEGEVALKTSINPLSLLPKYRGYYAFQGSLTTPPCTEGVQWVVMKSPIEASRKQIHDMHDILHDVARAIQPTNNRLIESAN